MVSEMLSPGEYVAAQVQSSCWQGMDVRSEGEFRDGHLAMSINLPILRDDERRLVGTAYKQEGMSPRLSSG